MVRSHPDCLSKFKGRFKNIIAHMESIQWTQRNTQSHNHDLILTSVQMGGGLPHTTKQFSDTSRVSHNSTEF